MKWLKLLLRLLIGAFFIFSAYGKMASVTSFEIYVFRSSFLSYDVATFVARLIIAAEFIAGIAMIFKFGYNTIWKLTMLFVLILTAFLAKQLAIGDDENCFCLGELLEMSPTESLLKNVALIVGLLLIRKDEGSWGFKYKNAVIGVVFTVALATPFIISPPDVFVKDRFSQAEYSQQALDEAINKGEIPARFIKGRKLLSFYSMKCRYCKMSSTRISGLVEKQGIDRSQINVVFAGLKGNPIDFFEETHSQVFEFSRLYKDSFLAITKGRMPLSLLIKDGKVVEEMNFKTIDDKRIIEFLRGN